MAQPGALFATLVFLLARDPASNELLLHWFKGPCCQDDICRQASVLRSSLRNLPVEEYGTLFVFFTVTCSSVSSLISSSLLPSLVKGSNLHCEEFKFFQRWL